MRVYSVDKSVVPLRRKEITIAENKMSQNERQFGVLRAHYSIEMTTLYMEHIAGISSGNPRASTIFVSRGFFDSNNPIQICPAKKNRERVDSFLSLPTACMQRHKINKSSNPCFSFDPVALRSLISHNMLRFF